MGEYFRDEFQENIDLFDDFQEEVVTFCDSNLKEKLEEQNNQHFIEINCLKERMMEQYHFLKQDYDALPQKLIEKDEVIEKLQDSK